MVRLLIYLFFLWLAWQVVKIYWRIKASVKNSVNQKKADSKYRNIEEADFKEIRDDNKKDQE